MEIKDKVRFWEKEAIEALFIAEDLCRLKHYVQALFFAHLALEKLLKAKILEVTQKEPLYSHDLVVLAKHAKIKLCAEDLDFLTRVNVYNIRARYQDYKRSLHRQADKKFTAAELALVKRFFRGIK